LLDADRQSDNDFIPVVVGGGVNPRKSGGENACLHGSKRENAALTATHQRIAPSPRQGCASPSCIRPQPALDPATRPFFITPKKHFLCPKKMLRQIYADFDRHRQSLGHLDSTGSFMNRKPPWPMKT
jgi:hypothetical protein